MVKRKSQRGGALPIAGLVAGATAINELGKKYKPVSKLDDFLTATNMQPNGNTVLSKIAKGALHVGKNVLGWGNGAMYSQVSLQHPRQGQNGVKSGSGKGKRKMIKV